jgi:hypothetical protein
LALTFVIAIPAYLKIFTQFAHTTPPFFETTPNGGNPMFFFNAAWSIPATSSNVSNASCSKVLSASAIFKRRFSCRNAFKPKP